MNNREMRAAISVGTPEKRRLSICVHSQSACTAHLHLHAVTWNSGREAVIGDSGRLAARRFRGAGPA
jgi:hypothetical protein